MEQTVADTDLRALGSSRQSSTADTPSAYLVEGCGGSCGALTRDFSIIPRKERFAMENSSATRGSVAANMKAGG